MGKTIGLIRTFEINKLAQFIFNVVTISEIYLSEYTDHVNAIFRTGPLGTHAVRARELLPAGTMLVTVAFGDATAAVSKTKLYLDTTRSAVAFLLSRWKRWISGKFLIVLHRCEGTS